ncbi:nucleoid-associated protein [Pantoea eucrina]|uniref:Nucleoid-associated protein n=1 Tax=Pantoea eucrina TaxID=472693 RepID=A0ABU5LJ13_9GAMM|nr:nucleoid-associated protein [Pantoea eucrina]MDZ7279696.1 nucleoid-associated protein [Pantoea eucrina]
MTHTADGVLKCSACGSEVDIGSLCDCGYDPALELQQKHYLPQFALTATLEIKEGNEGPVFVKSLGKQWTLKSDDVQQFIQQIEKKFNNKRKIHGVIDKNIVPLSPPGIFNNYLDNPAEFDHFVDSIMELMKREANEDKSKLTGGAIVFIHYKITDDIDSDGRLFIIMVDRKGAFNFDDNLIPEKLPSIDIDSLRQAVLVDLTLFRASYPDNSGDPYLHFINGKSRSEFFKRALGCNPKVDNNRSLEQANAAVDSFAATLKLTTVEKVRVKEAVASMLNKKSKDQFDKKVTIEDIEKVINTTLPDNKEVIGKFVPFVNANDFTIDAFFEPSIFSSKSFDEIKICDDDRDYVFTIDVSAISADEKSNKKVIYDRVNGHLIVKLSDSGIAEIEKIFGSE